MALVTFGTNATSTLTAMQWLNRVAQIADIASICNSIKDDDNPAHPRVPGAFANNGVLFIPNRGVLRLQPTDWVGLTSTGFPILVDAASKTADFTSA